MSRRSLFLAALAGAAIACASGRDPTTAAADHTAGDPTTRPYPWLWANESEAEFKEAAGRDVRPGDPAPVFLPSSEPLAVRLQTWLDLMDAEVRRTHPEALRATPRPRVLIQKTSRANANVDAIGVRWRVETRFPRATGSAPSSAALPAIFLAKTGSIWEPFSYAFDRRHGRADLEQLVGFMNESFDRCRFALEGETLRLDEGCLRIPELTAERASTFEFSATARHVRIATSYLFEGAEEPLVVFTLAHELAHFYRAHPTVPEDRFDYLYSLDRAHTHRPEPDPRFAAETAAFREKLRGFSSEQPTFEDEAELMTRHHLGFYSFEQEADELALELVTKVGLPPDVGSEAMLRFLRVLSALPSPPEIAATAFAECTERRARGFRDAQGRLAPPPIGPIPYSHHAPCFRVFNMDRETAAHRYVLGPTVTPPGRPWSELLAELATR